VHINPLLPTLVFLYIDAVAGNILEILQDTLIGKKLNDEIHRNKRISNPYFVRNTLRFFGIEQAGSNVKTNKRKLLAESFEEDCIDAFRTLRKQRHGSQHSLTDTSRPQTKA